MRIRMKRHDESGVSLVELMIAMALFAVVVAAVDSSITVVEERSVQVSDATQALDRMQIVQQAITTDIHAALPTTTAWSPAVPTTTPGAPITATSLAFQASLNNATATIGISLNTTTHILTVTCTGAAACPGPGSTAVQQAQVSNIDSSSLFTLTTSKVTTTIGSVTTNTFFYTSVASTLILDSPRVGAPRVSQTKLTSTDLIPYNVLFACQTALAGEGATGSC